MKVSTTTIATLLDRARLKLDASARAQLAHRATLAGYCPIAADAGAEDDAE